jgi:hypothetical protein
MIQIDHETARRRAWLGAGTDTMEQKRQAAIAWLGERWVLHPANAPKKGKYHWGAIRPSERVFWPMARKGAAR